MANKVRRRDASHNGWNRFNAEAAYADSIFRLALGDLEGSISALERALEFDPTYAPAILSMGSVEYQRRRKDQGRTLFLSLLALPENTPDLCEIIDEAGSFLIQIKEYDDGLELFHAAVEKFPSVAALYQGLGCCAGHKGLHTQAVQAAKRALELEHDNQEVVNDLGWSLLEAGQLQEAREMLRKAVSLKPDDELARQNLQICEREILKESKNKRNA